MRDIWKEAACVNVASLSTPVPRPTWRGAVPMCGWDRCPNYRWHLRKACALSDAHDVTICLPVAYELGRTIESLEERFSEAEDDRDAARADARVLAHAYQHDSRPPAEVVERALAYPEKEET